MGTLEGKMQMYFIYRSICGLDGESTYYVVSCHSPKND